MSPLGLDEAQLADTRATLSREAWLTLLDRTRKLTGEPAIGFHLGLRMRISAFGYLGFTAMSAPTLGDALALTTQFAPVITNAFELKLRTAGSTVALVVDERIDFGGVRDVVLTSVLVGLAKVGSALTGRDLPVSIDLVISEPPYYRRFAHVVPAGRAERRATRSDLGRRAVHKRPSSDPSGGDGSVRHLAAASLVGLGF